VRVTNHAVNRWRERTGSKHADEKIRVKIRGMVDAGEEMEMKKKFRVLALIDHRFDDAKYIRGKNGMIFVVVNDTVVTIHNGRADRWERKQM